MWLFKMVSMISIAICMYPMHLFSFECNKCSLIINGSKQHLTRHLFCIHRVCAYCSSNKEYESKERLLAHYKKQHANVYKSAYFWCYNRSPVNPIAESLKASLILSEQSYVRLKKKQKAVERRARDAARALEKQAEYEKNEKLKEIARELGLQIEY